MFTTIIYSEAAAPGGCLKMVPLVIGVNPCNTNFIFLFLRVPINAQQFIGYKFSNSTTVVNFSVFIFCPNYYLNK